MHTQRLSGAVRTLAFFACIQSPWNDQKRFTVHGSRGGFSSVFLGDFHPSMQNSILECKKCQPFDLFTTTTLGSAHGKWAECSDKSDLMIAFLG